MTADASPKVNGSLQIPPEVKCEYAGISQGAFHTDLEAAIQVFERFPDRFEAATGHRVRLIYSVPGTAYEGVAALGGRLVFPEHHQSMISNQGRILTTVEQVDSLVVPDPWESDRFRMQVDQYHELKKRFGGLAGGGMGGQEGPITTAGLLRGEQFFVDCVVDPDRAHRLLDVCTEMFIRWRRATMEVTGARASVAGICDDYAGMLGPDMFPEFVVPYYRRIYEALGKRGGHLHTELVRREHLAHLRELDLSSINFAEDEFLTIAEVRQELPDVPFSWHIKTVAEMLQGTPDLIRRRFREIVAEGMTQVNCELTVGTPAENIRAFLQVAAEYRREA